MEQTTLETLVSIYVTFTVIIFVLASLTLDDKLDPYFDMDRKIVGWMGLLAPLWPLTATVLVLWLIGWWITTSVKRMSRATRGRQ